MTYHHFCVTLSSLTISLAFLLHFSPTGLTMAYDLLKDKTRQFIVSEKYLLLRPPDRNERGRIEYKTSYACDGNVLGLSCRPNESISLVRANYGRFSLSICNDGGKLDLRVNCMSFRSYLIMQDRCSGKSKCNATVSSDLFGDPCHGTPKYLEVQYHCVQNNPSSSSSPTSSFSSSSSSSSFSSVTTTTTRRPPTDTALPVHPWILRPSTKPSDRETGLLPQSPVITTTTVRPTTTTAVPVYQFSLRPSTSFDWDFGSPSTSFSSPPSSSNDNQDDDGSPDSHHRRHHHHDRNKENNSNDNYNSNSNINSNPPSVESSSSSSTFNLPGDENLSINWLREVVIIGMSALCFLFILVILYTFSRLKEAQTSTPDLYESTVSEVIVPKWAAYTVVTV